MDTFKMMMHPSRLLLALALAACGEAAAPGGASGAGGTGGEGGALTNVDGDCLDDAEEAALGTDPTLADTDGDGFDDCAELDCVSDPLDGEEPCYVCGWAHNDPGTLQATGAAVGDVIENLELIDQCKEPLMLWDLAGEYRILFMTAVWCGPCRLEAETLADKAAMFTDETGVPVSYVVVLTEDGVGDVPDGGHAKAYAEATGIESTPVTVDPPKQVLEATAWEGVARPGKCVLSPEMVMLACYTGEDDTEGFDAILTHAGLR